MTQTAAPDHGQPDAAPPAKAPFMVLALGVEAATVETDELTKKATLWQAGRSYALMCKPVADIAPTAKDASQAIASALNEGLRFDACGPFESLGWLNTPYGLAEVVSGACAMKSTMEKGRAEWERRAYESIAEWEGHLVSTNAAALRQSGVFGDFWLSAETQTWTPGLPIDSLNPEIGAYCALLDARALNAVAAENQEINAASPGFEPGAATPEKKSAKKPRSL